MPLLGSSVASATVLQHVWQVPQGTATVEGGCWSALLLQLMVPSVVCGQQLLTMLAVAACRPTWMMSRHMNWSWLRS